MKKKKKPRKSVVKPFDWEKARRDLKKACEDNGEDFEALGKAAGKHFAGPLPKPRTKPLTEAEIKMLMDDDDCSSIY